MMRAPISRRTLDNLGVTRAIEDADADLFRRHAFRFGERLHVLSRIGVEIDETVGIAAADGDLVHVDVGRVKQAAALRNRNHRDDVRHRLRRHGRSFERIEGDVDFGSLPGSDFFADEEHRCIVALALADNDAAAHFERVEEAPHAVDRRLVRCVLVTPPDQARGGDCRRFRHPRELKREDAVEDFGVGHGRSSWLSRGAAATLEGRTASAQCECK